MAGSAFDLSSGIGSDGKSLRTTKFQDGHGFSAGSVIMFDSVPDGTTGEFKLAQASGLTQSEAIGIVESVSANNEFTVVYQGEINTSGFVTNNGGGVTGHDVWFLDSGVSGGLTAYAPTSSGHVIKPILTLMSGSNEDRGMVTNYLGTIIGGSNTVSLDSVHPVGEIIAFAGGADDVPSGWQLCDGSTVDAETYPTYYSRVGTKYGYNMKMVVVHQDDTFVAGHTAAQSFGSGTPTRVEAEILSWDDTLGTTGARVVDPDVLSSDGVWDTDGTESNTDDQGYPHGQEFSSSRDIICTTTTSPGGNTPYSVDSSTITHVKTPNLQARVLLGAGDAQGTFDGYTAGQMSGAEDAVGVQVEAGAEDTWVYNASSAAAASIMQPYLASNFIIRIDDTAKAALVDAVNVSLGDDGLTDHYTAIGRTEGDVMVFDPHGKEGTSVNQYKNVRLFTEFPDSLSDFESGFRIDANNNRLGIGKNNPDYEIHVQKNAPVRLCLEDLNGGELTRLFFQVSGSSCYIQSYYDNNLYIRVNNKNVMRFNPEGTHDGAIQLGGLHEDMACPVIIDNKLTIGEGMSAGVECLDVYKNLKVRGQMYSSQQSAVDVAEWSPNFDKGNVVLWNAASNSATTTFKVLNPFATPDDETTRTNVNGGFYSLIMEAFVFQYARQK